MASRIILSWLAHRRLVPHVALLRATKGLADEQLAPPRFYEWSTTLKSLRLNQLWEHGRDFALLHLAELVEELEHTSLTFDKDLGVPFAFDNPADEVSPIPSCMRETNGGLVET